MPNTPLQIGTQNPELKNSPIAWEGDEETETLRESLPSEPVCFFNDREYPNGAVVISGSDRLRCERGVWIPTDSAANRTA
jgi:hypothetical protein